ncbi:vacuolar sorting protein [Mycena floridula]|nr:vacuolar sorting protein [Mycena floridula]
MSALLYEGENLTYSDRAKEFVELHEQVQTSVNLLDSLESFLSTFQKDLSAVSGQISELQDRSKHIENRLKSRRKIEKPLSSLISDITVSPALATLILDTNVGEAWITAIDDLERRLDMSKVRSRVKAARDLGEVAEGLRIVAATKLRGFFLSLFQPIRGSVTTNMQVMQTSVLLKYRPLFAFLQRQAPTVASELQRSYIGAARVYYETGFRRYARSLGYIKARTIEKFELITTSGDDSSAMDLERLSYGKIEGPGVALAFMADDKAHKEPIEALMRSLMLVFMDNASAEYTFVKTFFAFESFMSATDSHNSIFSPQALLSPEERLSVAGSDYGGNRSRANSLNVPGSPAPTNNPAREEHATADVIWKQVMDPVVEYLQAFVKTVLEPMPPVVPLLTMIRLTEDVITEVEHRGCAPVVSSLYSVRLQLWPVFQKAMTEHVEALKKLAEGASTGYLRRVSSVTEATVLKVCRHYVVLFNSFVTLTRQEEETMIFANLLRLRQELAKLIQRHASQVTDPISNATTLSEIYENLLLGLSRGAQSAAHPKSQQELAYWANLDEEAKRKVSVHQSRGGH